MSILVPHDGSEHAQAALEYALETFPGERIVLFHAIDPFERSAGVDADDGPDGTDHAPLTEAWHDSQRGVASELFEKALERLEDDPDTLDIDLETDTAVGSPPQTIVGYVEDATVDQVVMGSRGGSDRRGTGDLRLGSTAELVVRRVEVPVTVVR